MDFAYVYILQSQNHPERYYIGLTEDLRDRLQLKQFLIPRDKLKDETLSFNWEAPN